MSLISRKRNMNPFYQEFEFRCPVCGLEIEGKHTCPRSIKRIMQKARNKMQMRYGNDFFKKRNR